MFFKNVFVGKLAFRNKVFYSSLRMNGNQKLDVYDQKKQNLIERFSQIVKVMTEDDMGHPDIGDLLPCSKRS